MIVRLLKREYIQSDLFFNDFKNDRVNQLDHFSSDSYEIDQSNIPFFPIYISYSNDDKRYHNYLEAIHVMIDYIDSLDRTIVMNPDFWISLMVINYRDELIKKYPPILKKRTSFDNIILKKFNWENYIYKMLLMSQFLVDHIHPSEYDTYIRLMSDNMDVYNYMIKYPVYRNDIFVLRVLKIIDKYDISSILKEKIKSRYRDDKDLRVGRKVIFEFNKNYPIIIPHMMNDEEFEAQFMKFVKMYANE